MQQERFALPEKLKVAKKQARRLHQFGVYGEYVGHSPIFLKETVTHGNSLFLLLKRLFWPSFMLFGYMLGDKLAICCKFMLTIVPALPDAKLQGYAPKAFTPFS